MADVNFEHIGHALRKRRVRFGLDLRDMVREAAEVKAFDLRWTENAQRPSMPRVRYYDQTLRATARDEAVYRVMPYAQREQWYDTELDVALWRMVMVHSPRVVWWWGTVRGKGSSGAWCYLCKDMIYNCDIGRPLSHVARVAIMQHRGTHPVAGMPSPAPIPEVEPA